MNIYKQIYKKIKKYDTIVLARHIGADPDALGSTIGLRETIKNTFPYKKVYAVGTPASRHKYIGILDEFNESMYNKSLLIVLDTPNIKRVDGVDITKFECVIKIDHHPFIETMGEIELIDDTCSSASQLVLELIYHTKLKPTKKAAEALYTGIVGDTNRFLYYYTTSRTFELVSKIIKDTNIDFTSLYENMYLKSIDDFKFQNYIINNITLTPNGLGYIKITQDILDEFKIDCATATNVVNSLTYIIELKVWVIFAYDKINDNIRGSIRSRNVVINDIASNYNGGGHIYASGVRLKSFEDADKLVKDLDNRLIEE